VSSTYFISDIHLDPSRPELTGALENFLQQHHRCDALYILGDLFETWIGDDDDTCFATEVMGLLRSFSDGGSPLYLLHGNRDFLLGSAFCACTGARLLPESTVIDLYGTPTLLMHGDSLCTADRHYQSFRHRTRLPQWQADMLARSLTERRGLALQLRALSRESASNKAEDIVDVTPTEVDRVMARSAVTRLIHGHTHRPARHTEAMGERWVLGDWHERGWAIEASPRELTLYDFPL